MNLNWHDKISFVKSVLRIISFIMLPTGYFVEGCIGLVVAELIGICEELPDIIKRTKEK